MLIRDFPGVPEVKSLPFNAGDMGLIHGRGTKIPQATRLKVSQRTSRFVVSDSL